VYSLVAGAAGDTPPAIPKVGSVLGAQADPWYLAVAACDVDGNGSQTVFWGSSVDSEIRKAP
jgi:hypothetical protein